MDVRSLLASKSQSEIHKSLKGRQEAERHIAVPKTIRRGNWVPSKMEELEGIDDEIDVDVSGSQPRGDVRREKDRWKALKTIGGTLKPKGERSKAVLFGEGSLRAMLD
jgi:hypothetical protein